MSFAYPAVLVLLVVPVLLSGLDTGSVPSGRIALPFDHGGHASRRVWAFCARPGRVVAGA